MSFQPISESELNIAYDITETQEGKVMDDKTSGWFEGRLLLNVPSFPGGSINFLVDTIRASLYASMTHLLGIPEDDVWKNLSIQSQFDRLEIHPPVYHRAMGVDFRVRWSSLIPIDRNSEATARGQQESEVTGQ